MSDTRNSHETHEYYVEYSYPLCPPIKSIQQVIQINEDIHQAKLWCEQRQWNVQNDELISVPVEVEWLWDQLNDLLGTHLTPLVQSYLGKARMCPRFTTESAALDWMQAQTWDHGTNGKFQVKSRPTKHNKHNNTLLSWK